MALCTRVRRWFVQSPSHAAWSWILASFFLLTFWIDVRYAPVEHVDSQPRGAWALYFRVYEVIRDWSVVAKVPLGVGLIFGASKRLAAAGAVAFGALGLLDVAVRALGDAPRRACGCLGSIDIEPGSRALLLIGVIGLALVVASDRATCRVPTREAGSRGD